MEIDKHLLDLIAEHRRPSDARHIAELNGTSVILIHKAFGSGKCSQRVHDALSRFYEQRAKAVASLLEQSENSPE